MLRSRRRAGSWDGRRQHQHLEAKTDDPGEDVLSDLAERVAEGDLTLAQACGLGHVLLVAGHDTSADMITLGTALLLENPDQLAALRAPADDEKYVANAVEELLRYLTIPHLLARRAVVDDIEIDGEVIRAGEGVIASLPAANWDPARIELHVVLRTLFRRVPTLRAAVGLSELTFKEDSQAYGIHELPVAW